MGYRNTNSPPRGLHYGGPVGFPYRILGLSDTGQIAVSDDGLSYALNAALGAGIWRALAFDRVGRSVLAVVQSGAPANTIRIARSTDGDTWVTTNAPAPGMNAHPCKLIQTSIFGGSRIYCQARDNGASLGGIWFSLDGGQTWAEVTWPHVKALDNDIQCMAVSSNRLVCAGRFLGDANNVWRIFFTTDGTNMVAGPVGITSNGLSQSSDGFARSAMFFNGQFVMGGNQVGAGFVDYVRSPDGVTVSGPDDIDGSTGTARMSGAAIFGASGPLVFGYRREGIAPTCLFARTATGVPLSWVTIPITVDMNRVSDISFSPSLNRMVASLLGQTVPDAFAFSNNGIAWTAVPFVSSGEWTAIVATR